MSVTVANKVIMEGAPGLWWSSIGMKVVMAVTGFSFIGFIIGHLAGNLQIFIGQDQLNTYAEFLHSLGEILWVERIVIALFFIVHIVYGVTLFFQNNSARPTGYRKSSTIQATYTSRTMIWTGLLVLSFVVYHLLHYTFIVTNPEYTQLKDPLGRFDVYSMVILGFQNIYISIVYIIALFFLALHLSHALPSLFQTVGLIHHKLRGPEKNIGRIFALIIFIGYVSIPLAVLLNIVRLPEGGM